MTAETVGADVAARLSEDERYIAIALCNADTTWAHHDATDDHPCSQCMKRAPRLLAELRRTEYAARTADHAAALRAADAAGYIRGYGKGCESAAAVLTAVRALAFANDDGTEYEHNGHGPHEGEPECPGCWAASITAAFAAARSEAGA